MSGFQPVFSRILIANRGEIACRIIATARRMGIKTVAVYSDADAKALHVEMADRAVRIGPAPASESYLRGDAIIAAAKDTGAEAIHPGYGFLSENPQFADAVEAAGLIFIGPTAASIRAMGLKDAAKRLMEKAGVPVVPGYHGDAQETVILAGKATEIGYPVLIKAAAGGGGKGMRKVERPEEFREALASARREAKAAFGDDRVLVEKYIEKPRHIEVQVFGDSHGNIVHLFERDCSAQRRHQKVIEEAPAPGMTDEMRAAMTQAAVKAAKAIDYRGAGTIEFIVDGSQGLKPGRFWFMEMNTRLQVEHPVTELVTGLDLVEWQLRVAAGEPLPLSQGDIHLNGHAFEARIYAEDAAKGFLPATGTLHHLRFPENARADTGVRAGDSITPFYDPMIAKLAVHGPNRAAALEKLRAALAATEIAGSVTNRSFLHALACHPGFTEGDIDTGLIARDFENLTYVPAPDAASWAAAAMVSLGLHRGAESNDPFDRLGSFALWAPPILVAEFESEGIKFRVELTSNAKGWNAVTPAGALSVGIGNFSGDRLELDSENGRIAYTIAQWPGHIAVLAGVAAHEFRTIDPFAGYGNEAAGGDAIIAPMPGLVRQVSINPGALLKKGESVAILEAMKMEHALTAPRDGRVKSVLVSPGDQVSEGAILVSLEPEA